MNAKPLDSTQHRRTLLSKSTFPPKTSVQLPFLQHFAVPPMSGSASRPGLQRSLSDRASPLSVRRMDLGFGPLTILLSVGGGHTGHTVVFCKSNTSHIFSPLQDAEPCCWTSWAFTTAQLFHPRRYCTKSDQERLDQAVFAKWANRLPFASSSHRQGPPG